MAHPKRRQSKSRRDKRRTHYKATASTVSVCSVTSEPHLFHRAYWVEEGGASKMYYKGKVVLEKAVAAEIEEEDED